MKEQRACIGANGDTRTPMAHGPNSEKSEDANSIQKAEEKMSIIRTYSQLISLSTFEERFKYLKLKGAVGEDTFGFNRYFNQRFYASKEWKSIRESVIIRDNGCDLGISDRPIGGRIYIHHMNPITMKDIEECTEYLISPQYLITVSLDTHNAIHYGDESILNKGILVERKPNDVAPWKR